MEGEIYRTYDNYLGDQGVRQPHERQMSPQSELEMLRMPYYHNFVTVIVDFTVKLLLDFNMFGHEGENFHQWPSLSDNQSPTAK